MECPVYYIGKSEATWAQFGCPIEKKLKARVAELEGQLKQVCKNQLDDSCEKTKQCNADGFTCFEKSEALLWV